MQISRVLFLMMVGLGVTAWPAALAQKAGDAALGTLPYDRFEMSDACASCHLDINMQHEQAMMSQSFTHPWDEIEYFKLALPHSQKEEKVAGIKAGCIGCHAPLAFLAGDIPPQRPSAGTRANEGVSCDLCHSITGFEGEVPFNFNYIADPGATEQGIRSDCESPAHKVAANSFLRSAEFCGTCHNEKDPWGVWVKSTQLEWREGPYAKSGVVCQDCHMPPAAGNSAPGLGKDRPDVRQHLFHGAHDPGKLRGVAEVRIHPDTRSAKPGDSVAFLVTVVNAKAGHMIPSGSAEERLLWLHVEARDSAGATYHLAVTPKGFQGEEMTIASSSALAYQDIGDIQGLTGFRGLARDAGVPEGDRIFRLPYLDPDGRMTVAQWHTASLGPDYRLAPLKAVNESFTWKVPPSAAEGRVVVTASIWYSKLVPSVAEFLGVPPEEATPQKVNDHETWLEVRQ
ncbi:MAG: multiheme c-type cytochrome [Acidobacteriota bacterium]